MKTITIDLENQTIIIPDEPLFLGEEVKLMLTGTGPVQLRLRSGSVLYLQSASFNLGTNMKLESDALRRTYRYSSETDSRYFILDVMKNGMVQFSAPIRIYKGGDTDSGSNSEEEYPEMTERMATAEEVIAVHTLEIGTKASQEEVTSLGGRMAVVESSLADKAAASSLTSLSSTVSSMGGVVSSMGGRMTAAEETISSHTTILAGKASESDLITLGGRMTVVESSFSSLSSTVSSTGSVVSSMGGVVSSLEGRVTALESAVGTFESDAMAVIGQDESDGEE